MEPKIHAVFEPVTGTWQYIVADPSKKEAVLIDTVLDYDKEAGLISTASADKLLEIVASNDYFVSRILETHAHADHLTASRYLQNQLAQRQQGKQPLVCIGKYISQVQETMGEIYGVPEAEMKSAFDHGFSEGEKFSIGNLEAEVLHLPGHTPDHIGYLIGSNIFVGDSMFNPDVGSARCDFPGGSATALYQSMQKLLSFPPDFKIYVGHDYPPKDRSISNAEGSGPIPYCTVEQQRNENKHVKMGTPMQEFVKMRSERDSTLSEPKLILQSMNVNVRGGRLPMGAIENFKLKEVPANI
jgi:glyoxylase-like metal-dependent hydrolase (beta-lactamase superfamily II)